MIAAALPWRIELAEAHGAQVVRLRQIRAGLPSRRKDLPRGAFFVVEVCEAGAKAFDPGEPIDLAVVEQLSVEAGDEWCVDHTAVTADAPPLTFLDLRLCE